MDGRDGEKSCITNEMEMVRGRRRSTGCATPPDTERGNLTGVGCNPEADQLRYLRHPHGERSVTIKMFNKVQVVYYLTRNGHLQHPHYLEVSHLATQPLRLRDVIDRLAVLRGKAMSSQYSWSCKRSYKNGYVWNDLTENDIIYAASEGSEYVLKGSELIQAPDLFENKEEELQIKGSQQGESSQVKHKTKYGSVKSKSHQSGHSFRQATTDHIEQNEDDEVEEASCNSSNAQMEQDQETYSLPSTSSTNSDKHQLLPPQPPPPLATPPEQMKPIPTSESKQLEEKTGNPSALTRNPVLLQLIACGGGSMGTSKEKPRSNPKGGNVRNFNFNTMRSSIMPCLKQQLSTRSKETMKVICNNRVPPPLHHDDHVGKDEDDEDMIMVRYISENPRFGNLQSEEKEYFSGTIVETMTAHHQHTPLAHSHDQSHLPVFTKSSSYNEQRSCSRAGLEAAEVEEDKGGVKLKGFIKCIPRKKSCSSTCSMSNRF